MSTYQDKLYIFASALLILFMLFTALWRWNIERSYHEADLEYRAAMARIEAVEAARDKEWRASNDEFLPA